MSDSDLDSGGEEGGGRPGFSVPFEVLPSARRGSRSVVILGYHYHKDKFNRYKCIKSGKQKCRARAHLDVHPLRNQLEIGDTGYCKLLNGHTCGEAPGRRAGFKKQLRRRMMDRAVAELTLHPATIYNEEREKFLAEFNDHEDLQLVQDMMSDLQKDSLKKAMWRARQDAIPRIPQNARDALNVSCTICPARALKSLCPDCMWNHCISLLN